jgi:hypothetical protein
MVAHHDATHRPVLTSQPTEPCTVSGWAWNSGDLTGAALAGAAVATSPPNVTDTARAAIHLRMALLPVFAVQLTAWLIMGHRAGGFRGVDGGVADLRAGGPDRSAAVGA